MPIVHAVTALGAGTLATAPAAFAATSAPSGQADATLCVFPEDADLAGVGTSGFLSYSYDRAGTKTVLWTPFDGGMSTRLKVPEGGGSTVAGSDVVVIGDAGRTDEMSKLTLRNMADPSAPVVDIDLGALSGTYLAVVSPTSVLAQITKDDGTTELHVVTKTGATTTSREIAGLPEGATEFAGSMVHDGSVLVGPLDAGDAVWGEPGPGPVQECDRGGSFLVGQQFGVGHPGMPVDRRMQVHVPTPPGLGSSPCLRLGPGAARALSELRPWARQPPPSGMRPTFFTSTWTMWPGRFATIVLGLRFVSPSGSMNLRRFRPRCASNLVTVRRLTITPVSLSSNVIRGAGHLCSRRIASIRCTMSALVALG